MGDSPREVVSTVELHCLYKRTINDKERTKNGVTQMVDVVVYVSPLELEKRTGSAEFTSTIRNSYSTISVEFNGKHYEVTNIIDLEPIFVGGKEMRIAYQINLHGSTGNKTFD